MILQRFFKPKWQHKDPQVRKQALQTLSETDPATAPIFAEAALQDSDPDVRRTAVKRVFDIKVVDRVLSGEKDDQIREAAKHRLQLLLSGKVQPCPGLEQRLSMAANLDDSSLLEFLVKEADEPALRMEVLKKIQREALLGDVASQDEDPSVRLAAVEKIQRKSTLERVCKAAKGKDKKVSQLAKDRLSAIEAEEQRPQTILQQTRQICVGLEALFRSEDWHRMELRLQQLQQQWSALAGQWDEAKYGLFDRNLQQRYNNAVQTLTTNIAQAQAREAELRAEEAKQDPLRAQKRQILDECEQCLTTIETEGLTPDNVSTLQDDIMQWQHRWDAVEPLSPSEENKLNARFQQAVKGLRTKIKEHNQLSHYQTQLEALLARAESLDEHHVMPAAVDKLKKQKHSFPVPAQTELLKDKETRLNSRLAVLEKAAEKNRQQRETDKEHIVENVKKFSLALDEGRINACFSIKKNIQHISNRLHKSDLAQLKQQGHFRQYNKDLSRFNELTNWRAWANAPVKQTLTEEMEKTVNEIKDTTLQHDYNAIAQFVKEKRNEWKRIGQSEAEDENQLWERFNQACNEVYEACRVHFQDQSRVRKEHKAQKEKICVDLEHFLEQLEQSDDIQWNTVEKIVETARKEWRDVGPVDRKHNQALNERFSHIIDGLKSKLKGRWQQARAEKEALIKKAEAIAVEINSSKNQEDDIRHAVNQIKDLQSQWKSIGKAAKERELWKQFRSFCDAVFNLREELHSKRDEQIQANIERKEALCHELETLLSEAFDRQKTPQRYHKLQQAWKDSGWVPKNQEKAFNQRWQTLQKDFEKNKKEADAAHKREQFELVQQKAAFLADVEGALASADAGVDADALTQSWQALPVIDDEKIEDVLASRFERIRAFVEKPDGAAVQDWLQKNTGEKQQLCLKMEIFAGVESPESDRQARMEFQVAQLAGKMTGEQEMQTQNREKELKKLILQWYGTGRAMNENELAPRFEGVLRRMVQN